jgi:hypothetical protein
VAGICYVYRSSLTNAGPVKCTSLPSCTTLRMGCLAKMCASDLRGQGLDVQKGTGILKAI